MRIKPKLEYAFRGLVILAALIMAVGFFAERHALKSFCEGISPGISGDKLDSISEARNYNLVDPPDGTAFIGANAAYLPFRFQTCDLTFDSLLRHRAPVKRAVFEESSMPPMFWNYDLPTSIPFFVFVVFCNLLLALHGMRGFRIIGVIGTSVSIAFLLLAVDRNNRFYAGSIIGYGRILDFVEYLGFAVLAITLLSIVVLLANSIRGNRKAERA